VIKTLLRTESTSRRAVRPRRPFRDNAVNRARLRTRHVFVGLHSSLHVVNIISLSASATRRYFAVNYST